MALSKKQTVIHLHGSTKPTDVTGINQGELLILHNTDGSVEFGTLNNSNALVWVSSKEVHTGEEINISTGDTRTISAVIKTLEGIEHVNSLGGKSGAIGLEESSDTVGHVNLTITETGSGDTAVKTLGATISGIEKYAKTEDVDTKLAGKSDTGHTHANATSGTAGFMSVDDKTKLDGIAKGANNVTVAASDKVLTMTNSELSTTLSLSYGEGTDGKKYIYLKGKSDAELGKIDASDFIKDGMLKSAELVNSNGTTGGTFIKLIWNEDSGKEDSPMYIDVASLMNIYDGNNLMLSSGYTTATAATAITSGISVDKAIASLDYKVTQAIANAGVTKFGENVGEITVHTEANNDAAGTVQFKMEGNQLTATVKGVNDSIAYQGSTDDTSGATTVAGAKAYAKALVDAKNVSATGDTYISATASENKVTVSATTELTNVLNKANTALQSIAGETGDTALVSISDKGSGTTQSVFATTKLSNAVASAETAVQNVVVANSGTNNITATKTANEITLNFDNMIIDCGTF